jgi:hypothetical protein
MQGSPGLSASYASSPIEECRKNAILLLLDPVCEPVELHDSRLETFSIRILAFLLISK